MKIRKDSAKTFPLLHCLFTLQHLYGETHMVRSGKFSHSHNDYSTLTKCISLLEKSPQVSGVCTPAYISMSPV